MTASLTLHLRLVAAIAAVAPIDGVAIINASLHQARIDYQAAATAGQITAGNSALASFDWSVAADTTFSAQQAKAAATASIDNGNLQAGLSVERLLYALAIVTMNELNILRACIPRPIVSITRSGNVATVTTLDPHGLVAGDSARVMGATLAAYNVLAAATILTTTTFSYPVAGTPATPAVGSLFFALGAIPALEPRTTAQIVPAIKAQIAATPQ